MKKFLFALAIFAMLPFKPTHCLTEQETMIVKLCAGAGLVITLGAFQYYRSYSNNANQPTTTLSQQLLTQQKNEVTATLDEFMKKTDPDHKKFRTEQTKVVPVTVEQKNTQQPVSGKMLQQEPSKQPIVTAAIQPTSTEQPSFLNNIYKSAQKMNLDKLLLENMDVLEG